MPLGRGAMQNNFTQEGHCILGAGLFLTFADKLGVALIHASCLVEMSGGIYNETLPTWSGR